MFKASACIKIMLLLLLFCGRVSAQINTAVVDSIVKHTGYYSAKKSNPLLFVHLDKTVYINNDMMWFTAYLLGAGSKNIQKHQVLSVALVNNNDQKIAVQGKFAMAVGLAYGNVMIPDSVPPGHYSFIAYTNRMVGGRPEAYFLQAITLKTATDPAFSVELVLDTLYKSAANVRILLNTRSKNGPLADAVINYYLGKNAKTRIAGKAKTNVIGSYTLMIPKDHVTTAQHNLEVQVKSGSETKTLHLNIPIKRNIADVKFYPEGGHQVAGLPGRVGWEVKTPGGTAIKTAGILYAGKSPVDTIVTDSYGMGAFYINPLANVNYTVRLLLDNVSDSVYTLPAVLNDGVSIRMTQAVVNDTLKFQVRSKISGKFYLLVHNYKEILSSTLINGSPKGQYVKITLRDIPRGLNTITVLDSLQRPCAERLFFAHYNQRPRLSIATDNKELGTRQKMHVKIRINNSAGKPDKGIVSVACVQDNRLELRNDNNIEHYVYLQSELDNLPLKDNLMGNEEIDHQYLNELMLVRGWSKYKWPELVQALPADTTKKYNDLLLGGVVTHLQSTLKKPVQLVMMKDSAGMITIDSDNKGMFALDNSSVYTLPDKKARLIVNGKSDEYEIKINDPYPDVNKTLAKNIDPVPFDEPIIQNTKELVLKGFEHATNLKEVVIKSSNNSFRHGFGFNSNACGDYVCKFHILNCRNHTNDPENRPPMQGEMVMQSGLGLSPYRGCADGSPTAGMLSFTGIYTAKEYYGANYALINPTEPDYLSTICWKHSIVIDPGKETDISFYTSDITGKFRIVVQGITNEDVIYGEDSFTVRKKTP